MQLKLRQIYEPASLGPNSAWCLTPRVCMPKAQNKCASTNIAKTPNRNIQAEIRRLKCSWNWAAFEPGLQLEKNRSETGRLKCSWNAAAFRTGMQLDKMLFDKQKSLSLRISGSRAEMHRLKFNGFQLHLSCANSAWFLHLVSVCQKFSAIAAAFEHGLQLNKIRAEIHRLKCSWICAAFEPAKFGRKLYVYNLGKWAQTCIAQMSSSNAAEFEPWLAMRQIWASELELAPCSPAEFSPQNWPPNIRRAFTHHLEILSPRVCIRKRA